MRRNTPLIEERAASLSAPFVRPERTKSNPAPKKMANQATVLPWRPFPLECLPPLVASYVLNAAESIGCDPALVAVPLLAALASAIGTTRRLLLKRGWTEPAILWALIVGESGTHKSPALEAALRGLRRRQSDAWKQHQDIEAGHQAALAHHEKALAAWKRGDDAGDPPVAPVAPVCTRYVTDDATVEALAGLLVDNPRGLLLARDELAAWFGSFDKYSGGKAGSDAAKWLELHGGRSLMIDRKTGIPKTLFVPLAAVSVTGSIQPAVLRRALTSEHRESGLAARLLFCSPPRSPKRWTEDEIDPQTEAAMDRLFEDLHTLQHEADESDGKKALLVRMTPAAKRRFVAFVNDHGREHHELSGELAAAWSKLESYAARLALVHHVCCHSEDPHNLEADESSIEAGITLSRWFAHEARRLYESLAETDEDRERRELVELIGRKGGRMTARELMRSSSRYRGSTDDAEAALQSLVEGEFGRWEMVSTATNQRRDFVLNPRGDSDAFPENPEKSANLSLSHPNEVPMQGRVRR